MSETRYFQLRDEHGIDHEDNLKPIADFALSIPTLVSSAIGVTEGSQTVPIRPAASLGDDLPARVIPDTRIVETRHGRIAESILSLGIFEEIPAPTKAVLDKAHKETRAHVEALKARDQRVKAGDEPAPDATDQPTTETPDAGGEE